ncbi:MAG: hypothetical protein KBT04_03670 [Bacteroidales bacterium]|nr:hypothetical protein [Candidatus Colimorpha onthohippi]
MNTSNNRKKKLIVSLKNLSDDLKELLKETYPEGYNAFIQKTIKPNGDAIYVVPLETEDTSYMVKLDVKIDTGLTDEVDPDPYGDESKDDDFNSIDSIESDENNHTELVLRHGNYEDDVLLDREQKGMSDVDLSSLRDELNSDLDDDDSDDDFEESKFDDDPDLEEPTLEDLQALEAEFISGDGVFKDASVSNSVVGATSSGKKTSTGSTKSSKSKSSKTPVKRTAKSAAKDTTKKSKTSK